MCLSDEDVCDAYFAYSFMLGRMGEEVALETAAETLRARHRELSKTAAAAEARALVERIQAGQAPGGA